MSRPVRHAVAVTLLAIAGLVIAVALGILVSRTASQSVALGGQDLGNRTTLVVTPTTPARTSATRPATTTTRPSAPTTTTTAPTITTPAVIVPPTTTAVPRPQPTTTIPTTTSDDHRGSSGEHTDGAHGDD